MKITEYLPEEFDKLESAWKKLEKGVEMTWFQTFDWYKIVNRHFMAEKKKAPFRSGTYILVSDDNGAPLMIAPIQIVKIGFYVKRVGVRKGFYFLGRQGFSDYLNFIYTDYSDEIVKEILKYLKNKYKINTFYFENVSSETGIYQTFQNIPNVERTDSVCMRIVLPDNFEDYRMSLAKSVRRNMTTAFNRAKKNDLEFTYEIARNLDQKTIDELQEVYSPRYEKKQTRTFKGLSKQAQMYNYCREKIIKYTEIPVDVLTEIKDCWCLIAKCNGEIAAFFFSVYRPENKTTYQLIAGVNEKYQWYGPGKTQLYNFIQDEINNGKPLVEVIDLTRGNEGYKYDFNGEELRTSQFLFSI